VPFNRWNSLPPTTQAFWDTIPDAECIADVSPETPTDDVPVEDIPSDPDESGANLLNHGANGFTASSNHGEIGNVDPSRLADNNGETNKEPDDVDTYGDLVSFIQTMTDVLDEATDDV
jgi:hypothetical protein